jgi:peptidoglycan-N-acetylglucosamine deacetylase
MTVKWTFRSDRIEFGAMHSVAGLTVLRLSGLALILAVCASAHAQEAAPSTDAQLPNFSPSFTESFRGSIANAASVAAREQKSPEARLQVAAESSSNPDSPPQANRVGAIDQAGRKPRLPVKRPAIGTASGCGSAGAIGVSRTVSVNTASGPQYGHQQFKDINFLNDGEVVLTFDDGPLRPYTMPVLKALEAHCTKATFFVVGRMAISDPALVRETEKRGHTVGTHTWSHMDLRKTNPVRAKGEIELGFSAVSKALGHPASPFFRFPFLSSPKAMQEYARSRQIAQFSIEVDSNDYRTKDPTVVHQNVLSQLAETKKGIILFHDIQPSTAGALKGLLDELHARGFKVVHLASTSPVVTLPEYDAIADKEMARKSEVASADPLASRSIVWPISRGERDPSNAASKKPPVAAKNPANDQEMLPWGVVAERSVSITPAAKPKPQPKPKGDFDWATELFRF